MSAAALSEQRDLRASSVQILGVGLCGGLLSGLLGVGGGLVIVPLLVLWLGCGQRDAHAISLAAIVPISVAGMAVYGVAGKIDLAAAAAMAAGAVGGARHGTHLLARTPQRPLKAAFGGLLLVAAATIALGV